MRDFTFYCPTEVLFGCDTELRTADAVKRYGGNRLLVVYGSESAEKSGLLDRICGTLEEEGLAYSLFKGAQPNPRLDFVERGVKAAIAAKADMILGVGGGSAIDAAKAIAHGAANPDSELWDFWQGKETLVKTLPVGAIVTIPAAGSETSDSSVLLNEAIGIKRGLSTPLNYPRFAVMNPALAATLPKYQVACGVTDILMHTLERYFSPVTGNALTDEMAEALMRVVVRFGKRVVEDPSDYEAMSEMFWCGSLSHNGLTGLGGLKDFANHQIGHALAAVYDKAHGATLSAVWESWAKYVLGIIPGNATPKNPERFAQYAKNVWGEKDAEAGIYKTVEFFRELGVPTCLSELGISILSDEQLDKLSDRCSYGKTRTIGSFMTLSYRDIRNIYAAANR
ncbi:MAG: iron-containing alcohol dehydrogenase [Clostridiales bacterium]|nr:iron-containing alcohol dehydrogenase [Clostridiales bacterium]